MESRARDGIRSSALLNAVVYGDKAAVAEALRVFRTHVPHMKKCTGDEACLQHSSTRSTSHELKYNADLSIIVLIMVLILIASPSLPLHLTLTLTIILTLNLTSKLTPAFLLQLPSQSRPFRHFTCHSTPFPYN